MADNKVSVFPGSEIKTDDQVQRIVVAVFDEGLVLTADGTVWVPKRYKVLPGGKRVEFPVDPKVKEILKRRGMTAPRGLKVDDGVAIFNNDKVTITRVMAAYGNSKVVFAYGSIAIKPGDPDVARSTWLRFE